LDQPIPIRDQAVLVERWNEEARRWQRQRLTGELSVFFDQGVPKLLRKNETEKIAQ
jgi:hypothetical protein